MSKRYRTIVADPPWPMSDSADRTLNGKNYGPSKIPYSTMTVEEIKALPVKKLAQADVWGHPGAKRDGSLLYLWTTTQFLYDAHDVARSWGFTPTTVLVWCKPRKGHGLGGIFAANVEFVVIGRRGSPPSGGEKVDSRWFPWPRGKHSAKPEAFLDLVERVSPGPYLEMFARRNRIGWDTWGNEALNHVEIA